MDRHVLAQANIARMKAPLDDPLLADFVAVLDPVNAAAERSPGFLWRLKTEDGNATAIPVLADHMLLVNMSVWESIEALRAWVYGEAHAAVMRRRGEWFEKMQNAYTAMWWIPRETVPTVTDAEERIAYLRRFGPTPFAFTFAKSFTKGGIAGVLEPSTYGARLGD